MKKLTLVFLLLSCATIGINASEEKILIVEMQSGDKTTFLLTEKPEMSFSNHVLFIGINGKDTSFEISQVKQFYFEDASSQAGISLPQQDGELHVIYQTNDKLVIDGIGQNDKIRIYSIDGKTFTTDVVTSNGRAEISLSTLNKGTYLINVSNKQVFKIYRK